MKKLLSACAPFCLLLPHSGIAQDLIELDEIVVSATIEPQTASETGVIVDVLSSEDIDVSNTSVANAFDRLPGISVSGTGGIGAASSLRIRGLSGRYIGVRIDGIDVTDPSGTQTQFDFGGLTGSGIGRVEIVKGSQSARYGSEAVAGVIDIATFSLEEDGRETRTAFEVGSFGSVAASVGHAFRDGNTALSFNLSRTQSDSFSAQASDEEADGFAQTALSVKGETEVGEGVLVGGSAFYRDSFNEYDNSFGSFINTTGEIDKVEQGLRVFTKFEAFGIEHEFAMSGLMIQRDDPFGFTKKFEGERTQLTYFGTTDTTIGTLSFGFDVTEEEIQTDDTTAETSTQSALLELLTETSDVTDLSLSLRYDDSDEFGDNVSGRIALAWQAQPDLTVRAVVGTGYRAPSLYERFGPFGNATLEIEDSRSAELGLERVFESGRYEFTTFYTEIDNLIDFGTSTYVQVPGKTKSFGFEVSGERELSNTVTISGNYTFTNSKTEGERLARVPRHDLTVAVDAALTDRMTASLIAQHVFDVVGTASDEASSAFGDYTLVGVGVSYDINDATEAYFRIENLFDEDYETTGGYNTAGRSFFAGIRAQF